MDGVHCGLWRTMSERNAIQVTFDDFMKSIGFSRTAGSWYRTGEDVVTVVQLQKSQYGVQYYVNVAVWLLALGAAKAPKEQTCHVRTRLSRLVGTEESHLSKLLNLEEPLSEDERCAALMDFLLSYLKPVLDATVSVESLRTPEGKSVVNLSLVSGPARHILAV